MASELSAMLDECPIIAAVKNEAGLEQCLQSEIQLVFILYGSVCEIPAIVQQVKNGPDFGPEPQGGGGRLYSPIYPCGRHHQHAPAGAPPG